MLWSVDRRARLDHFTKVTCGFYPVEADNREQAIAKITAFCEALKPQQTNWWLSNPLSCLNGPFANEEEVKADYLARNTQHTAEKFSEFTWLDRVCAEITAKALS